MGMYVRRMMAWVAPKLRAAGWLLVSPRALKAAGILAGGVVLMIGLGAGAGYYEYRTNQVAEWVGALLDRTNARRRPVGRVWQRLRAQAEVQETLDGTEVGWTDLPASGSALPPAVSTGRFEMRRIPDAGMPGYVAIWRTPVPAADQGRRRTPEVVESFRVYQQGLRLLETAVMPEARYRNRARDEVARLYRQLGEGDGEGVVDGGDNGEAMPGGRGHSGAGDSTAALPPGMLMTTFGDTVAAMHPDSLREAVFSELTREVAGRLQREAHARLLADFQVGRVAQMALYRGLGRYQGEATFDDAKTPTVAFEVDVERLVEALRIDVADRRE